MIFYKGCIPLPRLLLLSLSLLGVGTERVRERLSLALRTVSLSDWARVGLLPLVELELEGQGELVSLAVLLGLNLFPGLLGRKRVVSSCCIPARGEERLSLACACSWFPSNAGKDLFEHTDSMRLESLLNWLCKPRTASSWLATIVMIAHGSCMVA